MTSRLYPLLPQIHRIRDTEAGRPVRALLGVIEEVFDTLRTDIDGLYDDWFIETCDEWVVSYLGDLLGARPLKAPAADREGDVAYSLRAYVANTLGYRRRKGTAAVTEQLARDVTGWPARAVEYFELLAATQHLNHLRLHARAIADLRDGNALEHLGSAFDPVTRTVNVRSIADAGRIPAPDGRHNIPNLGLHLWRLQSYWTAATDARPATTAGCYTFDPLGRDRPLFNRPRTEAGLAQRTAELNAPVPLRRRALHEELEGLRAALAGGAAGATAFLDRAEPALQVALGRGAAPVPADEILVCDLSTWQRPPATKSYPDANGVPVARPISVAVDPVLGRLALPASSAPAVVEVGCAYGFGGDLGGGPYDRTAAYQRRLRSAVGWQAGVSAHLPAAGLVFATLRDAVAAWNALPPAPGGRVGVIAVMDSASYAESLTGAATVEVPAGSQLFIIAADWPETADPATGLPRRLAGDLRLDGLRPHLRGDLSVRGVAAAASTNPGELVLNGLLVEGRVSALAGNLGALAIDHCTLARGFGGVRASAGATAAQKNARLAVAVDRSICDAIDLAATVPQLAIADSIVGDPDAGAGAFAADAAGAHVTVESATIFGATRSRSLDGSNALFDGGVLVEERQRGCLRYSYVRERLSNRTPRRFRCQPDLALAARAAALGLASAGDLGAAERDRVIARVQPGYTSSDPADAGFAQLRRATPPELREGAEDGAEMGAFRYLQQPSRAANLAASLQDYLRLGLEAGVFFET
jgi:hypothetical protein